MGPITPGHGATEVLDENLSYQDGEEPLKKAELIPLNEVDNRYVEEGVVVLSRPDADIPPAKYEQDTKTKEKNKDTDKGKSQEKGEHIYKKGIHADAVSSKESGNRSGTVNSHLVKQQVVNSVRAPSSGASLEGGSHQVSSLKVGDKDVPSPGDRLPPPGPSVVYGLPTSGNPSGGLAGSRSKLVRLHEGPESSGVDYGGSEKAGSISNVNPPYIATLEAGEPSNENENMRLESHPDLASRAAITFALMQTDDKTHTQCDDAGEENATRAAPFTMASQWGAFGSSDEGSDNQDSEDDGGGDKGKKSARARRLAMMNTLADEDDHQLDSMARNSLVLLDERDGHETLRTSLVFEDDNTDMMKMMQSSGSRGEDALEDGPDITGRHSEPIHQHTHTQSQDKSFSSSPRKMPEKLAKDIDNRIGSPLKQNTSGSPSKFVFKNRDAGEEKRNRKLVALGKPPIHSSSKRDKSLDMAVSGMSEGPKSLGTTHFISRDLNMPVSKPKSILKDKNTMMSERNSNVDNRFSTDSSMLPPDSNSDLRVVVTMKDEPNAVTPREQSPRRPQSSRHSSSKSRESESFGGQHLRRFSRQAVSSTSRGFAESRSLVTPESDSGPVPKPPPGHAPKNAVVTAR